MKIQNMLGAQSKNIANSAISARFSRRFGLAGGLVVVGLLAGCSESTEDISPDDESAADSNLASSAINTWIFSSLGTVSSADHFVQTNVSGITSTNKRGAVVLRQSSADKFVGVFFSGDRYQVVSVNGGAQKVEVDLAFASPGSGTIRAEVSGTKLTSYFNGKVVDSRTIASLGGFTGKGTGLALYQDKANAVSLTSSSSGNLSATPPTTDPNPPPVTPPGDVLPGTNGCPCERPVLASGVIPTPTTVGACGTMKKTYTSKVIVDSAFIASNGGSKVVHSIETNSGIEIKVPGVTLCNFKADGVKISSTDARIQDGTLISSDSSLFVTYAPLSSGLATRLYVEGGNSDAIRVTETAAGKTQAVTQSYFKDIAKYRGEGAHADLVQTYPTINGSTYHSSLIQQNYFSSALYAASTSGYAVNATWMAMPPSGARFEGNLVDRVNQGFWYEGSPNISIINNLFNSAQVNGLKDLTCDDGPAVKRTGNYWFTWVNGSVKKGDAAPRCP